MAAPNQLLDFLTALKKRRWQVAVPALLIGALGCSFAVIVPKNYLLSTRIEIAESRLGPDATGKGGREPAARREAPSVADHMTFARVQKVIESQLEQWPEYMQAVTQDDRNVVIKRVLEDQLSASSTDRTNNRGGVVFVDLRFQDENKERAARFLEELASSWLEDLGRDEEEKLVLERAKLKEISDSLSEEVSTIEDSFFTLAKKLGLDPTEVLNPSTRSREDKGDWTFSTRDETRTELQHTETLLATAQFDLEQAHKRHDAEPDKTTEFEPAATRDRSDELLEAKEKLEKLEEDCQRLRPDNSQYRRKREDIEKLKEQIREFEQDEEPSSRVARSVPNPQKEKYLQEVRTREDEVARLTASHDMLLKRVEQLESDSRARTEEKQKLENLRNEYEEARDVLNAKQKEWRAKDHELKLLESSPDPWKIVQPPSPSRAGVTPNPWLISAFAIVAGIAAGVGLAVASEFARSSYRTVADLASVMSVPVLGAIETIVTRRERRRRQANRAVAALSTALIVGCIGWVTWMWATAPERLPIEVQAAIERLREALAG